MERGEERKEGRVSSETKGKESKKNPALDKTFVEILTFRRGQP
jgi:hypothetical protein